MGGNASSKIRSEGDPRTRDCEDRFSIDGITCLHSHPWLVSVATVEAVWDEEVNRRGTTIVTMAELSFSRTAPTGETIACRHEFEIGMPRDGFKVGDQLDIVPATGTCQRADIIGRTGIKP